MGSREHDWLPQQSDQDVDWRPILSLRDFVSLSNVCDPYPIKCMAEAGIENALIVDSYNYCLLALPVNQMNLRSIL